MCGTTSVARLHSPISHTNNNSGVVRSCISINGWRVVVRVRTRRETRERTIGARGRMSCYRRAIQGRRLAISVPSFHLRAVVSGRYYMRRRRLCCPKRSRYVRLSYSLLPTTAVSTRPYASLVVLPPSLLRRIHRPVDLRSWIALILSVKAPTNSSTHFTALWKGDYPWEARWRSSTTCSSFREAPA